MKPEQSVMGRALTLRDTLMANGRLDGSKTKRDQPRRTRGTGWQVRVAAIREKLNNPPANT